jgi:hypothetical protein
MPPLIEFTLIAIVYSLGPYPVAIKSYPSYDQCRYAAGLISHDGAGRGECIRVTLPVMVK